MHTAVDRRARDTGPAVDVEFGRLLLDTQCREAVMARQPEPEWRRPPYRGERPRQADAPFGYAPPYVPGADRPTNPDGPRGTVYGPSASPYGPPEAGYAPPNPDHGDAGRTTAPRRRRRVLIVAGIVAALAAGGGGAAAFAWHGSGSPADARIVAGGRPELTATQAPSATGTATSPTARNTSGTTSLDPGVAMCAQIRDTNGHPTVPSAAAAQGAGGVDENTAAYRYMRRQFVDSRFADVRDAGTGFLDTFWQLGAGATGSNPVDTVKELGARLTKAYGALSTACANHGVKIPPMTAG